MDILFQNALETLRNRHKKEISELEIIQRKEIQLGCGNVINTITDDLKNPKSSFYVGNRDMIKIEKYYDVSDKFVGEEIGKCVCNELLRSNNKKTCNYKTADRFVLIYISY